MSRPWLYVLVYFCLLYSCQQPDKSEVRRIVAEELLKDTCVDPALEKKRINNSGAIP